MKVFYNEFDKNAAEWLRNLGAAGEISQGVVDERSIKELSGADLAGVRRAHFFAGIGGWDLALRLAGWDDREVWTGSCPCQPYSSAGKGQGDADPRNLWPDFFRLIKERRPQFVFGEQVASAIKHGWLDRVFADLEGIGYTCGAAVLGAHSVGANHIRQRLFWGGALGVQHPQGDRREQRVSESGERSLIGRRGSCGLPGRGLAQDPASLGRGRGRDGDPAGDDGQVQAAGLRALGGLADDERREREGGLREPGTAQGAEGLDSSEQPTGRGSVCGMADDLCPGLSLSQREVLVRQGWGKEGRAAEQSCSSPWSDFRLVPCTDGRARRTGARVFPLAYGIPRGVGDGGAWRKGLARSASRARVGMLKGSGNAIVPALAAEFVRAFIESTQEPQ